jgi:hypothetical protein
MAGFLLRIVLNGDGVKAECHFRSDVREVRETRRSTFSLAAPTSPHSRTRAGELGSKSLITNACESHC